MALHHREQDENICNVPDEMTCLDLSCASDRGMISGRASVIKVV